MPTEEAISPDLIEDEFTKALVRQRDELKRIPGSEVFMKALEAILDKAEQEAKAALRGHKTFTNSAKSFLGRTLVDDEDFRACVTLSVAAGDKEKAATETYANVTEFFFRFHRALTGIRGLAASPWQGVKEKLAKHAADWYMQQKRAKEVAEKRMAELAKKEQHNLEEQAQEALMMGDLSRSRELLSASQMAATPMALPSARPIVSGAKLQDKWEVKVTDVMAAARKVVDGEYPLMHSVKTRDGMIQMPLLILDERVLRAIVDRQGEQLAKDLPGVTVEATAKISPTGRK